MCGIFGYIGKDKKPASLILEGLKSLEYRGYDSWGIVVISNGILKRERHVGKIGEAKTVLPQTTTGMGHTRWATHGGVTVINAHPHFDCSEKFAVIHNGIIENERALRRALIKKGHKFSSQTDTETIVHLLEEVSKNNKKNNLSLVDQVRLATSKLEGAFAIGVIDRDRPEESVLARFGGPLVVGITDGYKLFASDPTALLPFTKNVIYLKDREIAWITPNKVEIRSFENHLKRSKIHVLDWDVEESKKGGYPHFMLKEIMEQPLSLTDTMRGRIRDGGLVKLGGLESVKEQLRDIDFIRFIACGTASYAGLYGASVIQELTSVTADVEIASEFNYGSFNWPDRSAAWFISQSGETADVLKAVDRVKREKILSLGLVNMVGSSTAQATTAGVYLHAGPEIGVASTKVFTSQMISLLMIACWLAQLRGEGEKSRQVAKQMALLSKLLSAVLNSRQVLKEIARELVSKSQIFFLGRGRNYPLALEGALKLREVAYIDTVGMPTGELKHGAIAAMDKDRPAIIFAPSDGMEMKNRSSVQELKARDIPVYVMTDKSGRKKFTDVADRMFVIPDVHPILQPILLAPIVQILAYEAGVLLDRSIDKPRNLAKSVTVE
ncbi:glutamine--fructose-6-phosphate transaminase (isomerizing) [Candidatus Collierbacteria bacterium]|nr:glutamine--fructose-6-phosphate transaminase (isomerizing) [Candidatus Collierbacteria bacterium]